MRPFHRFQNPKITILIFGFLIFENQRLRADRFVTPNFDVTSNRDAKTYATCFEENRKSLALDWVGKEYPRWGKPCAVNIRDSEILGCGGATNYVTQDGEVYNFTCRLQGSKSKLLLNGIPHETLHMVLVTHFRKSIPRWADEGAACNTEISRDYREGHPIPLRSIVAMKEYPPGLIDEFYSQSASQVSLLLKMGSKKTFLSFVDDLDARGIDDALRANYKTTPEEFTVMWQCPSCGVPVWTGNGWSQGNVVPLPPKPKPQVTKPKPQPQVSYPVPGVPPVCNCDSKLDTLSKQLSTIPGCNCKPQLTEILAAIQATDQGPQFQALAAQIENLNQTLNQTLNQATSKINYIYLTQSGEPADLLSRVTTLKSKYDIRIVRLNGTTIKDILPQFYEFPAGKKYAGVADVSNILKILETQ